VQVTVGKFNTVYTIDIKQCCLYRSYVAELALCQHQPSNMLHNSTS